ncbi:MAG: D-alanyl-D-alanine carboxypeptidase/D-alanyl-D-alanine-endopeptidase [bacterium]|nr:D-alanyl-D-alanine carboxypeptidase/D-alanyl-D-alanine-endopeptidase [bacterium]
MKFALPKSLLGALFTAFFTALCVIYAFDASAQVRPDKVIAGDSVRRTARLQALRELQTDIDALVDAPEWHGATLGISVVALETGEIIYQHDADKYFTPASTQKLFTTAAALTLLGADYTMRTSLYLDGKVKSNGEFEGNIIIRGGGDPSWSRPFGRAPETMLDAWADVLDSLGIQSIKGNLIGDDDVFDDEAYAPGWSWDDLVYSYAAQVNGLAIMDNSVHLNILPLSGLLDVPTIRVVPPTDYVRVITALRSVDSSGVTSVSPQRDFRSNTIDLVGSISTKTPFDTLSSHVSIENPTMYFVSLFKDALVRKGIRFRGASVDVDDWNDPLEYDRYKLLAEVSSPPMSQLISVINHQSHNLGAEMLFKTLGHDIGGEGSFEKGAEVVRQWTQKSGIATSDLTIVDGSGLSRLNLCTPRQLAALLSTMHRGPLFAPYYASLAAPGETGTLRRRLVGTRAERAVRAKTGSMNNVSTLAGYVTTRDGEPFAVAIMLGNVVVPTAMAQNLQDLVCMRLASFSRKP